MRKSFFRILSCFLGALTVLSSVLMEVNAKPLNSVEKALIGAASTSAGAAIVGGALLIFWSKNRNAGKSDNDPGAPCIPPCTNKKDAIIQECQKSIFWDPGNEALYQKLNESKGNLVGLNLKNFFGLSEDMYKMIRVWGKDKVADQSKLGKKIKEISMFVRCVVYNRDWSVDFLNKILKLYIENSSDDMVKKQVNSKKLRDFKEGAEDGSGIGDGVFVDIAGFLLEVQCNIDMTSVWSEFLQSLDRDINRKYNSQAKWEERFYKEHNECQDELRRLLSKVDRQGSVAVDLHRDSEGIELPVDLSIVEMLDDSDGDDL